MTKLHRVRLVLLLVLVGAQPGRTAASTRQRAAVVHAQWGWLKPATLRLTGKLEAAQFVNISTPELQGGFYSLRLTYLAANASGVKRGQLIAAFDSTQQQENARGAKSQYEQLSLQVAEQIAKNRANAQQRAQDLSAAEAALEKTRLELRKAPILGTIQIGWDRAQESAEEAHLAAVKKMNLLQAASDAAKLKILEIKRGRQHQIWLRSRRNLDIMQVRAPIDGYLSLQPSLSASGIGLPAVGQQLVSGQPLARIYDIRTMNVRADVNQVDHPRLHPGERVEVRFDTYPGLVLPARLISESTVATAAQGSPVRSFVALFQMDQPDPRLLPDLSAAVDVTLPATQAVLVPRAAVHFNAESGAAWVTLRSHGGTRSQPVIIANYDRNNVAVSAGLRPGDAVIVEGRP